MSHLTLLYSTPFGIFIGQYHMDLVATAPFPFLGGTNEPCCFRRKEIFEVCAGPQSLICETQTPKFCLLASKSSL
jgi:hypothetical protein